MAQEFGAEENNGELAVARGRIQGGIAASLGSLGNTDEHSDAYLRATRSAEGT